MVPKEKRFLLRSNRSILRDGSRVRGKMLEIFSQPSDSFKVAVIVGKNVALSAVIRNQVRRRIQSILLERMSGSNQNIVVRAFGGAAKATYDELKSEITFLLSKTNN